MQSLISVAKALSDPNRVRAFWAIRGQELCVCQIVALLGLAQSTVSKHLSVLEKAGLVETEKRGRWLYLRVPGTKKNPNIRSLFKWMDKALVEDDILKRDESAIKNILKKDPEVLCRKQRSQN